MFCCYTLLFAWFLTHSYGPEGRPYSDQRVRPSVRTPVRPSVRHRLFLLTGSSLCSLLLRNYSTDFSNDDTNQLREQCRCATCTSFWRWSLHDCRSRSRNTSIVGNLDVWRVAVCVRFSSETTRPISPIMIPINWENNVDVQRALHFDRDPSMAAGQGHEILRLCEFICLTGSSLCSLLLRYNSTDFSNDDTNQLREQCRCATCTSFWPWPLNGCRSRSRNTSICEFRCLTGSSLCSLLLRNYSTDFSNDDTNQLREQCRCATCTSFWPWPLHGCRSRSQNTSILWI